MRNQERAQLFCGALMRQVAYKSWMKDGIEGDANSRDIALNIMEEAGEVATALTRERSYAVVAECVDVAHAALRLAIALDTDGAVLARLFREEATHG